MYFVRFPFLQTEINFLNWGEAGEKWSWLFGHQNKQTTKKLVALKYIYNISDVDCVVRVAILLPNLIKIPIYACSYFLYRKVTGRSLCYF